jgi:hypothetical protein
VTGCSPDLASEAAIGPGAVKGFIARLSKSVLSASFFRPRSNDEYFSIGEVELHPSRHRLTAPREGCLISISEIASDQDCLGVNIGFSLAGRVVLIRPSTPSRLGILLRVGL